MTDWSVRISERIEMKIADEIKREELTQKRRKHILDVATRVFSKKGFAGTQVDEVADRAGLGKGTVYRYFKDKKELFFSVVDRGMEDLKNSVLEEMAKEEKPLDKIKKAIETYLSYFEKNSNLISILIHEQSEFQKRIQKRYFDRYYEHINRMEEVFHQGIANGKIKKIDVKGAIGILTNMLNGLVYMWQLEGRKYSLSERVPMLLSIYFSGIVKDKHSIGEDK
jgi:AcrR family transcriptional regulator